MEHVENVWIKVLGEEQSLQGGAVPLNLGREIGFRFFDNFLDGRNLPVRGATWRSDAVSLLSSYTWGGDIFYKCHKISTTLHPN